MTKKILDVRMLNPYYTKRLNKTAQNYRKEYTNLIDGISKKQKNQINWWISPVASRNTFLDNCFYNICLLRLIIDEVNSGRVNKIYVADEFLKLAILRNTGNKIKVIVKKNLRNKLKDNLCFLNFIRVINKLKRRIEVIQSEVPVDSIAYKKIQAEESVLISTYVIASQFKDGVFYDRYFPGLKENTSQNIIYFGQMEFGSIKEGKQIGEKIKNSNYLIPFETLVQKKDYKLIWKYYMYCRTFSPEDCIIDGLDVSSIIKGGMRKGCVCMNSMYGILKGNAILRLINKCNIKMLIDWYEAQPSSKGMFYALRKENSKIKTIGYVLSPCPENNLGLYPSKQENLQKVVPDFFAIQGYSWRSSMRQFDKSTKCLLAPSFRYRKIFDDFLKENNENRKDILLVLPYSINSAAELIETFFKAVEDNTNLKIFFKNHPLNENYRLSDYGIKEGKIKSTNINFITGDMKKAIAGKKTVILSETTSALEIILNRIFTVIYIPSGHLDFTCIPEGMKEYKHIAYDAFDLKKYIKMSERNLYDPQEIEKIKKDIFTPITKNTIDNFLRIRVVDRFEQ